MVDQLPVGQNGNGLVLTRRQHRSPAWDHHQIPWGVKADAVHPIQFVRLGIQVHQQVTAAFHLRNPRKRPTGNPLRCESALLGTTQTDETTTAGCSAEILKPDATDDTSHRKSEEVDLVDAQVRVDEMIELQSKITQGHGTESVRQSRGQARHTPRRETLHQRGKEFGCIPEPMDENDGPGILHTDQ